MRSIFTITDDEKENNYYFKAENDYNSLEFIIKRVASEDFVVSNSFCANCQNAAEKYLKHIIIKRLQNKQFSHSEYEEYKELMKSHNLTDILDYMYTYIPNFQIDDNKVLETDEFYQRVRYPSYNSYNVTLDEMKQAWEALKYVKEFVDDYCNYK